MQQYLQNLKIERLNAMQEAMLEAYPQGKDVVLLSPTGSGKTLAYLLPLIKSLKEPKPSNKNEAMLVGKPSRVSKNSLRITNLLIDNQFMLQIDS